MLQLHQRSCSLLARQQQLALARHAQIPSSSRLAFSSFSTRRRAGQRPIASADHSVCNRPWQEASAAFSTSASHAAAVSATVPRFQPRRTDNKGQPPANEQDDEGKAPSPGEERSEIEVPKDNEAPESPSELKNDRGSSRGVAAEGSSAVGAGSGGEAGAPPSEAPPSGGSGSATSISKRSIPEVYPEVMALPISRRPLFPGFYKAVVIRDPEVVAAVNDMMKRGQPYIGAFLLKGEDADSDIVTDPDSVHSVGVFAQITATFPAPVTEKDPTPGLTAVLYPHRRIKITELLPMKEKKDRSLPAKGAQPPPTQDTEPGEERIEPVIIETVDAPEPALPADGAASSSDMASFQTSFLHDYAVSIVRVENLTLEPYKKSKQSDITRAVASEIISVFKEIATLNPLFRDQIANFSVSQSTGNVFEEPEKLADFAAAVSTGEVNELQDVLEAMVLEDRLQKAHVVLKKELMNAQLQSKISKDVENKIQKRQREYYLMEQLKGIKKELGIESDGKDKLVEKFQEKAQSLNMPEPVRKVFDEEISKLQHLEPAASEFNVTRNYLDWLTQIPWGRHSEENFSLTHATTVLDEDHYGLKDVKDRILEFLAVGKLRGTVEGKILCFVGPPGVGKTSIGKSIARALNRQFFRFSVGGLSDVAEIKGHRRTYVGSLPGKIIQALKKVQTENPLVLIDEVDKIGRGHNGDPSSALLEMLDPEQNGQFLDHYMDVPVDLSRVLFVCTANTLDTIPAPLLDRMEVLEVSGYITDEKAAIASRYLAPQAKDGAGLKDADVELTEDAVATLIRYYCRESGVRKLKQHIEKVYRKAALKIVKDLPEVAAEEKKEIVPPTEGSATTDAAADGEAKIVEEKVEKQDGEGTASTPSEEIKTTTGVRKPLSVPSDVSVKITSDNLLDYVGPPIYQKDRLYTNISPVGVSCGLGYLGNGSGATMPIEVTAMPGNGTIQLTGKLGEVIRESAQIALSFLKSNAFVLGLVDKEDTDILDKKSLHLHMPEGSIGKEGPSAGTAILTALVSLFSKQGIRSDLAMTGEITLAGQVLPVGGLKEKILAAHRAGIKKILAPAANRPDIEHNVPDSVKHGIELVYVENVAQVIKEAFEGQPIVDCLSQIPSLIPLQEAQPSKTE